MSNNFDSQGSRKVYNLGGHQSSLLAGMTQDRGNYDNMGFQDDLSHLTRSRDDFADSLQDQRQLGNIDQRQGGIGQGARKNLDGFDRGDRRGSQQHLINQKFDSVSQSQEQDKNRGFDSNFSQTHNIRRSESEFVNKSSFQTQKMAAGALNHPRTDRMPLDRIDENRSLNSRSGSRSRLVHGNAMNPLNTSMASKADLSIISQSNRLEESVKNPNRPPTVIKDLTKFLVDEHFKKTGVYAKTHGVLFNFWKDYVSEHYRISKKIETEKYELYEKSCIVSHHASVIHQSSAIFGKTKDPRCTCPEHAHPTSYQYNSSIKQTKVTKHTSIKKTIKKSEKMKNYEIFSKLYELDVTFTIRQDLEEEEIKFKSQHMQREQEEKLRREKYIRDAELADINEMLQAYYDDLRDYLTKLLVQRYEDQNESLHPDKQQHKKFQKQKGDSVDIKESVDLDRKEPKKPFVKDEIDKEKEKIDNDTLKELNFFKSLFAMVREYNMTNDPQTVFKMYITEKEKARLGVIWAKGDDDVNRIISEFFKPEKFLKRLLLLFSARNRQNQIKHLSLFGFYLQLNKKTKLLNFIDWKEVHRNPNKKPLELSREENTIGHSLERQLTFDQSRDYSVQEIIEEYEKFKRQQDELEHQRVAEEHRKLEEKKRKKLLEGVLGKDRLLQLEKEQKDKKHDTRLEELAKPKDRWKRGRILMELRKKFPHDPVLERMIKEEFKENRLFKYPEEYDLFDDEEDRLCKVVAEDPGLRTKNLQAGQQLKDKFKALDDQELYYLNQKIREQRREEREFESFLIDKVHKYLELKKRRLQGQEETMRQYVSKVYHELKLKFPKSTEEKFPHITYGTKKDFETFKKSYPTSFKKHFFYLVKSFVKVRGKGVKRLRNVPPTFIIPGGKRCHIHQYTCPEDCNYATLNKKVILKKNILRRHQKDPKTFRSRVWRRTDFRKALNSVFMFSSDLANCTYEPEANSLSKHIDAALKANPNLRNNDESEGLFKEPQDPEGYFKKLGKNFETSHPEVYKAGVLKRARLRYMNGKFEEAMTTLEEGFNILSIKKRYDPHYMKRFAAEQLLKIAFERKSIEKQHTLSLHDRIKSNIQSKKEQPESQKKKPEEDYENKKLLPILREAFDLVMLIEKRKKEAFKQIRKIERTQTQLRRMTRGFSTFKKSQTRIDLSKGEKVLFRTIMCPLKDKCNRDKRPRWPTSNTKSITKFGLDCPFAHHPMELKFPESILTKLAASSQTIKNIELRMGEEKPKEVFKPAGQLFDCVGCNSRSGKHLGGPCNLCRYKEMANEDSKKYTNKNKKESLMRSIERRESIETREDKKQMTDVMKKLDLDNNYTLKFGLLKKACVLHFYGRFNDAFDQIAKAAEIVQAQKVIEADKQRILEKRWRFKLGLDDGFELPIPIEQIDITKVDEKFLKKMDLQGQIQLSTLKLFIEQVSPMKNDEFSKHAFLNKLIEDNYVEFEFDIQDKLNTINKMKKQVEKLDEEADLMEAMGNTGVGSSPSPEKHDPNELGGGTMRVKTKKNKMCQFIIDKKKCPNIKEVPIDKNNPNSLKKKVNMCPNAHNPIELDLITSETRMKNLNGVIQSQTVKMKNMKPIEPWRPAKSGDIEHTHLMDMSSKKRSKAHGDDEEEEDDTRRKETFKKSIYDRENLFKKPYESNE